MTATLTLNIVLSIIKGDPGHMSGAGLVILGYMGVRTSKTMSHSI